MSSIHYFSPGPASLPAMVRNQIREELLDTFGLGISVMEISHRSKQYDVLNEDTLSLGREVFEIPETHSLIWMPMGAQHHFSLALSHLSSPGDVVSYTDTGVWAHLAVKDVQHSKRTLEVIFDGQPNYTSLGSPSHWVASEHSKFVHLTVNNTVYGTEYSQIPTHFKAPLVLDMTSSIAARRDIPWEKVGLIYASAQKNFGVAGLSAIIARNDLIDSMNDYANQNLLGNALNYISNLKAKSALNTPPVFAVYVANRMLKWIKEQGGVKQMEALALAKAKLVYDCIDAGFYVGRCEKPYRSRHNFVFKLPTPQLDDLFIAEALQHNIIEIKGYRSVGGVRASAYNGVSLESVKYLVDFMGDFRKRHG